MWGCGCFEKLCAGPSETAAMLGKFGMLGELCKLGNLV